MDTNLVQDTVLNDDVTVNSGIAENENSLKQEDQAQGSSDVEKINAIVQKRTERYRKQNAKMSDELAEAKTDADRFKMLSNAMKNNGLESIEDQANALAEYFGISKDEFLKGSNKAEQSKGDAYVDVRQFLNTADEDDIVDEFEKLMSKRRNSPKSFTAADNVRLTEMEGAYAQIRFSRDKVVAEKFCEQNGLDFNSIVKDADFIEFAKDLNVPISTAVKKWAKFSNSKTKAVPSSTGSVKDNGGSVAKDYYTPEEVDKLSSAQLDDPKIWEAVRKSMTKWKK